MGAERDAAAAVEALAGVRVLVVGDLMLDRFVYGQVERVSPEAPIPVLRVERELTVLGGAGNVLRNLAALGAVPRVIGLVGDDAAGREVAALLHDAGQPEAPLIAAGRATTVKERFVAGVQQLLRSDREAATAAAEADAANLRASLETAFADAGRVPAALVLSDYGKGVLTPAFCAAAIAAARSRGLPVVVDPKGRDFSLYRGATLVTPNRRELAEASGLPTGDSVQIEAACRKVIAEAGVEGVLATRSEQGMTLVAGDQPARHLPARAREVYDVSGAGDTVVAVVAAALGAGLPAPEAARLANVAAGLVVAKRGTAVIRSDELLRALHAVELRQAEDKLVDPEQLLAERADWARAGLTVGFTNGCFDLLHPGHISLLRQARAACDRLVVGLNSDESVRRLKGPDRPIQGEAARATVLASLECVDRVVVFADDTPLELIAALRPDVLVKGADYSLDQVVGGDLVRGYGGRVLLAELLPGHSTTATIGRLAR